MIQFDITVLVQIGVVLILCIVLNKILFKPIVKLLQERKEYIDSTINASEDRSQGINELVEKYEKSINEAKKKALAQREEIRREGIVLEREILEKAHREHVEAIHEAKLKAKQEFEDAQEEVEEHVKKLSVTVTEKILQRKI
jgi:F-type H+-transporting ATPase subunit b